MCLPVARCPHVSGSAAAKTGLGLRLHQQHWTQFREVKSLANAERIRAGTVREVPRVMRPKRHSSTVFLTHSQEKTTVRSETLDAG